MNPLTAEKVRILTDWYNKKQSETRLLKARKKMAQDLGLSLRQISNWIYHKKNRPISTFRLEPEKKVILLEYFTNNKKPSERDIQLLSTQLNLPCLKIKRWFYRKRHINKKIVNKRP